MDIAELSNFLKVLSDKNRMRILALLMKRKLCVCELAYVLGVSQPSISRHLKKLQSLELISSEQDGFWTNYYLVKSKTKVSKLMGLLKTTFDIDSVVCADTKKMETADRKRLCCK